MRDKDPPTPLLHPIYRKQRCDLLRGYDQLNDEHREQVRLAVMSWTLMERTRHLEWKETPITEIGEPRILGAA